MLKAYTNGMDYQMTPSLPSIGIPSNSPENVDYISSVISIRPVGSNSWTMLNRLLTVVSWKK